MKNTKTRFPLRFWKGSKYIKEKYNEDLENIVSVYKEKGYRDARVVSDSISYNKDKNTVDIKLKVEEGNKYYFGNIKFLGNSVYSDQGLTKMLGIKKEMFTMVYCFKKELKTRQNLTLTTSKTCTKTVVIYFQP